MPAPLPITGGDVASARKGTREVDFELEGIHTADIYDGTALEPGMEFVGPAIVETTGATVVMRPGDGARMDEYGNLHIELRAVA
jgi:N-methylhydantoinase A